MKAVVMAGGQGTRLRPLTSNQPKPMLRIVGRPMMEHILQLLRQHRVTEVVATAFTVVGTLGPNVGAWSDTRIPGPGVYSYRVRAFNAAGASPPSNRVTLEAR